MREGAILGNLVSNPLSFAEAFSSSVQPSWLDTSDKSDIVILRWVRNHIGTHVLHQPNLLGEESSGTPRYYIPMLEGLLFLFKIFEFLSLQKRLH